MIVKIIFSCGLLLVISGCDRVYLPNNYYLRVRVSGNSESFGYRNNAYLFNQNNKIIINEPIGDFIVKEPYVVFNTFGEKYVLLNTINGTIDNINSENELISKCAKLNILPVDTSHMLTFWDIAGGYKPYTWSHKKPWWVVHENESSK